MKFLWFVASSVAPAQFEQEWGRIPENYSPGTGIVRWVRSLAVREPTPFYGGPCRFSAIEELWLDPAAIDSVRSVMSNLKIQLGTLLAKISDEDKSLLYVVENTPVIEGDECIGGKGIRQFALTRRRADISHEDYVMHWRYIHAPLVRDSPSLTRYVQNRVVRDINVAPFHDACSELSFEDFDAVSRFCKSDAYLGEQIAEDAPKFVDLGTVLPTMVVRQWEAFRNDGFR